MRPVEFWQWWITDEVTGKRRKSKWKMSAETAAGYPGAERVPGSMEIRQLPESPDEHHMTSSPGKHGPRYGRPE